MKHWEVKQDTSNLYWNPPEQQATSIDIETTSYALLYHDHKKDYTSGWPILKWILKQRNSYGGFASTQKGFWVTR
ncbi:hypothetical protein KUTeg_017288 [Tegillarca granosa]|uniref:Alpha-macroglobulin-like TED domain-containing protein n=1 Tax=Tegillarca granosa TaxID=220873 RepID=A0ABQ9EIP8_TEGGR|nr:hypothetical protein KUTeg_017288 [Tegillarca granosa]